MRITKSKREYLDKGAIIDGEYRYALWRRWGVRSAHPHPLTGFGGTILWVMLNPSVANALDDDPTIRKVAGFTDAWGGIEARVVNICALRSTNPRFLRTHASPIGPRNDEFIAAEVLTADAIVLAWGGNADRKRSMARARAIAVWRSIVCNEDFMNRGTPVWHLGLTAGGMPMHPLMLAYNTNRKETDVGDIPQS